MAGLLDWGRKRADALRDVFDANTAADIQRRAAANQPRYYSQQQELLQSQGKVRPINTIRRNFLPSARDTYTNPENYRAAAAGVLRSFPRGILEIGQTFTQPVTNRAYIKPTDLGRVGEFILGRDDIGTSTQVAKDTSKFITNKELPSWAAVPAGVVLSNPAVRTPKVKVKATANDLFAAQSKAAQAARDLYPAPNKARQLETSVANPIAQASRIDKAAGNTRALNPDKSIEHLINVVHSSVSQSDEKLKQFGVDKIIQKYGVGEAGQRVNQYWNAKFALEVLDKRKLNIITDETGKPIPRDTLVAATRKFEKENPGIIKDSQIMKKYSDSHLDLAAKTGLITKDDAEYVKKFYKNYVPLNRVTPEELARPTVNANPVGSIGRQKVLQNLEGSKLPIDDSFTRFISRGRVAQRQSNIVKVAQQLYENIDAGKMPGKIILRPEDAKTLLETKAIYKDLLAAKKTTQRAVNSTAAKASKALVAKKSAEKAAAQRATKELRRTVQDPDARAAIGMLKTPDLIEIFKTMADYSTPGTRRALLNISKRTPAHAKLISELEDLRGLRDGIKAEIQSARETIGELTPDKTTGRQTISGFSDGHPFKVEVDPATAKMLQGLSDEKMNTVVKAFAKAWYPFRLAFTGLLNPIFAVKSFVLYDAPMSVINSPNGWATVAPKAMKEMFKSFNANSDFQKKLHANGAQVVRSSLIAREIEKSAAHIASRKDLGTKLRYAVNPKNIGQIADDIDIIGAKLQNATRTRVARAAYDKTLKETGSEEKAIAAAVYDFNNVLPNYQNASSLVRSIDAFIPYFSASISGTRSIGQAVRRRPGSTLGKAGLFLAAPTIAATAYSLSQARGSEFYQDMIDSKKEYILDNNYIVLLPGASKNKQTGEWTGVVKIPVPPEFRGMNRAVWRQARDSIDGNGITDPTIYAGAIFDSATGQLSPVDPVSGKLRPNINPAVNTAISLATNKNIDTGKQIVPDYFKNKPPAEQKFDHTPDSSVQIGNALGISPLKVQSVIDQFGLFGASAQYGVDKATDAKTMPRSPATKIAGQFYGAYGQTDKSKSNQPATKQTSGGDYEVSLQDDGTYTAVIGGEKKPFKNLDSLSDALRKDYLKQSDDSYRIVGDKVYRKNSDGSIGKTISKTAFDYQIGSAQLTQLKRNGDLNGWLQTADLQLQRIQKQLEDPATDPLERVRLENKAQSLQEAAEKYIGYGGFKKGRSGGGGRGGSGVSTAGWKTANSSKISAPKGISVRKLSAPTTKIATKKLAPPKLRSNYLNKRLA